MVMGLQHEGIDLRGVAKKQTHSHTLMCSVRVCLSLPFTLHGLGLCLDDPTLFYILDDSIFSANMIHHRIEHNIVKAYSCQNYSFTR